MPSTTLSSQSPTSNRPSASTAKRSAGGSATTGLSTPASRARRVHPHQRWAGLSKGQEVRSGGPLVLLYSTDLDQSVEAVQHAGGQVVNGPYAFPGGRRFHFTDPSGNELGVWAEA